MSENKTGVLLINLGSPKELTKKSVRKYLKVFLSDDYVLDLPKILQQIILRVFILPFRPKNTLEAYELIWTPEGSPLIISTESIAKKLSSKTCLKKVLTPFSARTLKSTPRSRSFSISPIGMPSA